MTIAVYFITENEDHESLRVKIRRSRNIRARLRALQKGDPYELKLMGWIDSDDVLVRPVGCRAHDAPGILGRAPTQPPARFQRACGASEGAC